MDVIQRKTCPVPASRCKSRGNCKGEIFSLENLTFKDPDFYIAGNLHKHILELESLGASEEVLNWLKHGVDVNNYFKHLKVQAYGSDLPSPIFSKQCF